MSRTTILERDGSGAVVGAISEEESARRLVRVDTNGTPVFFFTDRALTDEDVAHLIGEELNVLEPGVLQRWRICESTRTRVHFELSLDDELSVGDVVKSSSPAAIEPARTIGFARAPIRGGP